MSVEGTEQALPGFELEVVSRAERDQADIGADIRHKEFTGEMLRARYPGKYALAARAFFEKNRSAESICDILQISPQTMHALVETECAARGFSSVKARIRAKSASVALRTVSELQKLLNDPEAVKKAGIVGLTNALKALTGNEDGKLDSDKPKKSSSDDNAAADEFIDVYESADGFWGEKNPAPPVGKSGLGKAGEMVEMDGDKVPGASAELSADSLQQSDGIADLQGFSRLVAKSVGKSMADSRGNAVASCPAAPDAPTPPGGGAPDPARAGV